MSYLYWGRTVVNTVKWHADSPRQPKVVGAEGKAGLCITDDNQRQDGVGGMAGLGPLSDLRARFDNQR